MSADPNLYLSMMQAAIKSTNDASAALARFEQALLNTKNPRVVWECFEPRIRDTQLKRYYEQAMWLLNQESAGPDARKSDAQPARKSASGPAEPAPAPAAPTPAARSRSKGIVPAGRQPVPTARTAVSAQVAIMRYGGEAIYDTKTNHQGILLGSLTSAALEKYYQAETSLTMREYARLLMGQMPQVSRPGDVVRKYVSKELGNQLWTEALRRAQEAADD